MIPPRRGRRLTDGEIDLWLAVAATVAPNAGASLPERPVAAVPPVPPFPAARPGPKHPAAHPPAPFLPPYVPPPQRKRDTPALAPLEKRLRRRVARGRIELDGVLDLHGMTQAQAHGALAGFLRAAAGRGGAVVLVVTGKGRGVEAGVLRRAVPLWLRDEGLRSVVVGFEEAAQPHGGFGALYVRLRRQRPR